MEKRFYAIKNESYPILGIFIVSLLAGVIVISHSGKSLAYFFVGLILIIVSLIFGIYLKGAMFSYISLSEEYITYNTNRDKIKISYHSILEITKAYPRKRIFVDKKDLYEITVIKVVSKNTRDIIFHYISGPPIKSVKDINTPYSINETLEKGMWLSRKNSTEIINTVKNRINKYK